MDKAVERELLERATIGRLACVKDDQPYVVPLSFVYNGVYLYSFTTAGQKIDYMRLNPRVCVEFDEISSTNKWQSVIVIGRFEELTKDPAARLSPTFPVSRLRACSAQQRMPGGGGPELCDKRSVREHEPTRLEGPVSTSALRSRETGGHKAFHWCRNERQGPGPFLPRKQGG